MRRWGNRLRGSFEVNLILQRSKSTIVLGVRRTFLRWGRVLRAGRYCWNCFIIIMSHHYVSNYLKWYWFANTIINFTKTFCSSCFPTGMEPTKNIYFIKMFYWYITMHSQVCSRISIIGSIHCFTCHTPQYYTTYHTSRHYISDCTTQ